MLRPHMYRILHVSIAEFELISQTCGSKFVNISTRGKECSGKKVLVNNKSHVRRNAAVEAVETCQLEGVTACLDAAEEAEG